MAAADDIKSLQDTFAGKVLETVEFRAEQTVRVSLDALHSVLAKCRDHFGYEMLLDISAVDHLGEEPRFEVVYELATLDDSKHLRVKVKVAEDATVASAVDLWGAADWHEREVWDLMGVGFAGHPNLQRILMWEGYPYFPLRKDFPLAGLPTEMPDVAFSGVAPMEGGPFVASVGAPNTVLREPRSHAAD
ncbi:MAG: NADH-quinone oxidoreductase subunit C [Verrucomicrobia bacterium]|nr:MAG: NADH-quinone oxidoreductase subunit C [Verrucomicrobiota bacterium]